MQFDGKNRPRKEFLQDVWNSAVLVTEVLESGFIEAVLSKLKYADRKSVHVKQFPRIKVLTAYLIKRFARTKKYQWYLESIVNLRIHRKLCSRYGQLRDDKIGN